MPGRRYSRTDKANAVGLAVVKGQQQAAEELGIPETTLSYWMRHPEFAQLRNETRDAVAEQLWAGVQVGLVEVIKGLQGEAPLRDKAIALGVLWDKHALATGAATSRSESRDITGSITDTELIDIVRTAERLASPERAAPATEDTPAG